MSTLNSQSMESLETVLIKVKTNMTLKYVCFNVVKFYDLTFEAERRVGSSEFLLHF